MSFRENESFFAIESVSSLPLIGHMYYDADMKHRPLDEF